MNTPQSEHHNGRDDSPVKRLLQLIAQRVVRLLKERQNSAKTPDTEQPDRRV